MYFKYIFEIILFHANCQLNLFNYKLYIMGINDVQGVQLEKKEYLQNKIKLHSILDIVKMIGTFCMLGAH